MKRIAPFPFNYIHTWILFTIIKCIEKKLEAAMHWIDSLTKFIEMNLVGWRMYDVISKEVV